VPCFCVSDLLSLFLKCAEKIPVYLIFEEKKKKNSKSVVFVIKIEKDDNTYDKQSRIFE